MASSLHNPKISGWPILPALPCLLAFVMFGLTGGGHALAQEAMRPVPGATDAGLFPSAEAPDHTTAPGSQPAAADNPAPPSDARHPWEDDVPLTGLFRNVPPNDPRSLLPVGGLATPSQVVSDHGASAFDPTGFGFGHGGLRSGGFAANPNPPIRLGPFAIRGSAGVSAIAENETGNSRPTQGWRAGTQLSGSVEVQVGQPLMNRYLEVQYAGSYQLGGREEYNDTLDQAVDLTAHYDFAQLKLLLTGDYSHTTGPDRDVGLSVGRDLIAFKLDSSYPLSLMSSMDWTLGESTNQYDSGISSTEVRTALFFDRQISVKTKIGLGATFGTLQVEQGNEQTFEQINARATYVPGTKLALAASVGYEWRQVGGDNTGTPVFDASATYAVRPTTTLSLSAGRSVTDSAAAVQTNYISSTVYVAATQKIASKVFASLSLGYQNADYKFENGATGPAREDNLVFVRPDVTVPVKDYFSIFLYYSYAKNFSDQRSFQTQQISLGGRGSF